VGRGEGRAYHDPYEAGRPTVTDRARMTPLVTTHALPAADAAAPVRRLVRRVLGLAWPVLALQLLVMTVDLSDRFLVGHVPGAGADVAQSMLAAQGTAHYIAWFISSYTVLVTVGATAVVAWCVGAGDRATASRATHQALVLAALVGAAGAAVGLACVGGLVAALGLGGRSAEFAVTYLRPMLALLPFRVVEMAGVFCLVGAGDTRTGMWVQGGIALTNIGLAWALSRGVGPWPGLGFIGVPLGTAISYLLGAVAVTSVLARGRAGLRLHLCGFRPEWALMRRILRVSVPAGIDSLSIVAGQMWFLHIVNTLGDTAAAAHGIAIGWEAPGYLSGYAFGTAAMTLVGQYLGARQPRLANRAGWTAFGLGCGVMCLMGALFFYFAPDMFWLFCQDPGQWRVIEAGVPVLQLIAFGMPALASTMVFTAALRGAGDTRVPVLFTWVGFLAVRIPLAYVLTAPAYGLGLYGAWLAMVADLYVRGAFFAWRYVGGRWKRSRV
jgi:putative MATE family efflux protein